MNTTYSIAELSQVAGISPRTVRFYIQFNLLAPPHSAGRGAHYTPDHLATLQRIAQLQAAGHPLDTIRQILQGAPPPPPATPEYHYPPTPPPHFLTRIPLIDGVELTFDPSRYTLSPQNLSALQTLAAALFHRCP